MNVCVSELDAERLEQRGEQSRVEQTEHWRQHNIEDAQHAVDDTDQTVHKSVQDIAKKTCIETQQCEA
ncbi:hypothetical protein D3C85_1435930 [compost metagenome]